MGNYFKDAGGLYIKFGSPGAVGDYMKDDTCCCDGGCDCEVGGPTADFSYAQTDHSPCCFDFTNASEPGACGSIVTYEWDFGDGNTSTDQHPTHCYSGSGPWDVTLTVTDAENCVDSVVMEVVCSDVISGCCGCYPSQLPPSFTVTVSGFVPGCDCYNGEFTVPQRVDLQANGCLYYLRTTCENGTWYDIFVVLSASSVTVRLRKQFIFNDITFETTCATDCGPIDVSGLTASINWATSPPPNGWGCTLTVPIVDLQSN